jgi:hypothetical protein
VAAAEHPFDLPASELLFGCRAPAAGLVCQEGTGRRADPGRYWRAAREEEWKKARFTSFTACATRTSKRVQ